MKNSYHFSEGGTAITNFPKRQETIYKIAILLAYGNYNQPFSIVKEPMLGNYFKPKDNYSLHFTGKRMYTGYFFKILKQVENNTYKYKEDCDI